MAVGCTGNGTGTERVHKLDCRQFHCHVTTLGKAFTSVLFFYSRAEKITTGLEAVIHPVYLITGSNWLVA